MLYKMTNAQAFVIPEATSLSASEDVGYLGPTINCRLSPIINKRNHVCMGIDYVKRITIIYFIVIRPRESGDLFELTLLNLAYGKCRFATFNRVK
jgi:hypothetical protein